jgi:hypothetical protein
LEKIFSHDAEQENLGENLGENLCTGRQTGNLEILGKISAL